MNDTESRSPEEQLGAGLQTETFEFIIDTRAGKFFGVLTAHPKKILAAALLFIILIGTMLPRLYKDTSA